MISGSYKGDSPVNITGIDKGQVKCDCVQGSIVNGIQETILYSFALDQASGHKTYKQSRVRLFKKVNKKTNNFGRRRLQAC